MEDSKTEGRAPKPSWPKRMPWGIIIGLVGGFLIAALFFYLSQTERELSYAVNATQTRVVTAGQASGLEIVFKGEKLGDVDVTAAQVAIWNSGDESIRPENVLQQVVIYTNPPVPILEASVRKGAREPGITGFSIQASATTLGEGKVPLSWLILEKNDGASVQIIYVGTPAVDIGVQGLIEGGGSLKKATEMKAPTLVLVFMLIIVAFTVLTSFSAYHLGKLSFGNGFFKSKRLPPILWLLLAGLALLTVVIFFFNRYISTSGKPPFGF